METIQDIVTQELHEQRYGKRYVDSQLKEYILSQTEKINMGVDALNAYMGKTYHSSKQARVAQLKIMDIERLVIDIYVGVAYCIREELFTAVSAQLASRLNLSDKAESITTVAEILAVLCQTDVYDINKASKGASLMIKSNLILPDKVLYLIENRLYMPPMVCKPRGLTSNYSSGYLLHKDSLILGSGNHHDGDICLDVLNIMNGVRLKLDTQYLSNIEEDPAKDFTIDWAHKKAAEKGKIISDAEAQNRVSKAIDNWNTFKSGSYGIYGLLAKNGNRFYMTHKVDKRGRIYSQGYHVNPQGTSFKKAMCELAHEELIEGMP